MRCRGSPTAPGPRSAKVIVALPPGQVLRKKITLPAAVEQNLKQALAYDLDRHTPFKPDELYFDAAVVGRDAQKGEIRVDWAAALRSVVTEARRRAESWGAHVVAVTPDAPGDEVRRRRAARGSTCCRKPSARRSPGGAAGSSGLPLALVAFVALIAIALPIWQKRGYVIALLQTAEQGRVAGRRRERAARSSSSRLTEDYNFVLGKKYGVPEPGAGAQRRDEAPSRRHLAHAARGEERAEGQGAAARARCFAARAPTPAGSSRCSRNRSCSTKPRRARRRPRSSPGPGEIFDLGAQLEPTPPPPPVAARERAGPARRAAPACRAGAPPRQHRPPRRPPLRAAPAAAPAPGRHGSARRRARTGRRRSTGPARRPHRQSAPPAAAPVPAPTAGTPTLASDRRRRRRGPAEKAQP